MRESPRADTELTLGEVRLRRDGDLVCVDHATSVMWFACHVLARCRTNPDVGLSFDGIDVTLRAANGIWIWRLTGRRRMHRWSPDGDLFEMVEGVWPD